MKRLLVLFVVLFTVFFSYTIIAQKMGAIGKNIDNSFPEKFQKLVLDPLPAGTYSVGLGGYFPTIDSAFNKLSIDGVAGAVILELINTLYIAPTDSFGFFLNGPIPGAGPNSRVTIKPAANKNVTIEGNGFATLKFLNTNYLIVDGIGLTGATSLTIHTLSNSAFIANDGIDFLNNSDHNIIQNIIFINEDNTRSSGSGFWVPVGSSTAPDSNLIQNNFVKQAGMAFYISSFNNASVRANGNIIRGNKIGSETDSLIGWGIQLEKCQNTIVENNIVQNIRFYNNYINPGINSYVGNGDIIRNNVVHNIYASGGIYGGIGILLSGGVGNNNLVYNNMVYDIRSSSTAAQSTIAGIQMWGQINPQIFYNTVYLNGNGNGANSDGSAALYIYNACSNVDAKNNILVNTRDESPYCASSIRVYTNTTLTSDYNNLFYEASQNSCLVRIGSTEYLTLADWQVTGRDLSSITEMPHFVDPYLHIVETLPTYLERGATPIATITTDFDGDLRNATTPDIGADEFDGFTFKDPLPAGTYSIGTNGNFATIQHAFDILSTYGVAGPVTLELIDNLYTAPAVQFGFSLNGPIPGAGPNSRVTIRPAENKNVTIEGSCFANLYFLNTSYVTIDGVNLTGATTLSIHALYNAQFQWNDCIEFLDNSDHNVIQNTIFICEDITRQGDGIVFFNSDAAILFTPDSNLIQNNFIKKAGLGIYVGNYFSNNLRPQGNIIRGNKIGSETDSLIAWGINTDHTQNSIVEKNIVQNVRYYIVDYPNPGISSYWDYNCIIRNNVVHNIYTSAGPRGASGILLYGQPGQTGSDNLIYNNMVYDIRSSSTRVAGLNIRYQDNPKTYYNSVYLSGTGNGANLEGSAALYVGIEVTNVDAKNNILVNTRDESPYCASSIYDYTTANLTSDYNDLYYAPNQYNCLVRAGGDDYLTLADWQATGQDLNSVTEMPNFVSPYLHIDKYIATLLDSGATPIQGIDTDFDGETRNVTTPDIGADELDIVSGIENEKTLPTQFALEQNYPNPFNPITKISWQSPVGSQQTLKIYDILGNDVATLVDEFKPAGKYEVEFNAASLPSGVYFYQLKAGDYVNTKKMLLIK